MPPVEDQMPPFKDQTPFGDQPPPFKDPTLPFKDPTLFEDPMPFEDQTPPTTSTYCHHIGMNTMYRPQARQALSKPACLLEDQMPPTN